MLEKINKLMAEKDSTEPVLVAIDGMCGSGKTTLGKYLHQCLGGRLFSMDDYFLQFSQRSRARLYQVGGNVDYERFQQEVLIPVLHGQDVIYRIFSCQTGKIGDGTIMPAERLNIVEGVYSQHPVFGDVFDLKVFMEISQKLQLERIQLREGNVKLKRFQEEWIPKENAYFEKFDIRKNSQIIISQEEF